jgi:hypothetical protein
MDFCGIVCGLCSSTAEVLCDVLHIPSAKMKLFYGILPTWKKSVHEFVRVSAVGATNEMNHRFQS